MPEGLKPDAWRRIARCEGASWTIDERDDSGVVVGTAYRRADGSKKCAPRSRRGLIYPHPLPDDAGRTFECPVFVGEGATDTAALLGLGLHAVGVPMAGACGPFLAALLRGRHVAVVADTDDAGRRGAATLARHLVEVCPSVRIIEPPGGAKDVRAWVIQRRLEGADDSTLRAEVEALAARAEPVRAEAGPAAHEPAGTPVLLRADEIQARPVQWLWPSRIPRGALTVLCGRPGEGKSVLALFIAATVSRGGVWPDGGVCPRGSVLLALAEDDLSRVAVPRLHAAGADLERVNVLSGVVSYSGSGARDDRPLSFLDADAIGRALDRVPDTALVVLDPIGSFVPPGVDSNSDAEVRAALRGLGDLAVRRDVSVLLVGHTRKGSATYADDALLGSRAFGAIVRQVLHLMRDPDDPEGERRLLLSGKSNLGAPPNGLAMRIVPRSGPVGTVPAIEWAGTSRWTADAASRALAHPDGAGEGRSEVDDAAEWLRDFLADGPRPARDVEREARAAGYSVGTLRRAKAAIGVVSRKLTVGGWSWALPDPKMRNEDAHLAHLAHLRENKAKTPGFSEDAQDAQTLEGCAPWGGSCASSPPAGVRDGDEPGWSVEETHQRLGTAEEDGIPPKNTEGCQREGLAPFGPVGTLRDPAPLLVPLPPGLEGPPAPAWRYADPNDAPASDSPKGRFRAGDDPPALDDALGLPRGPAFLLPGEEPPPAA